MQDAKLKAAKKAKSSAKATASPASTKGSLTRLSDGTQASGKNKEAIALTGGSISPAPARRPAAGAHDFDLMDELAKSKAVTTGVPITSAVTKQTPQASCSGAHWLPANASTGASSSSQIEVQRDFGAQPPRAVPVLKFAPQPLMVTAKASQAPAESDGEDSYLRLPPAQLDRLARHWKARRKASRTRPAK